MGIAKYLKSGRMTLNSVMNQVEIGKTIQIPYDKLNASEWGHVYEKFVGQILEEEGFEVNYRGLEMGFLDRGIDLIASKEENINFIQCKYLKSKISKKEIDWILYKASNELYKRYNRHGKKIQFTLIVNDLDVNFSKKSSKNFKLNFTDVAKVSYPLIHYFLDHNYIQDRVKLQIREISMNR